MGRILQSSLRIARRSADGEILSGSSEDNVLSNSDFGCSMLSQGRSYELRICVNGIGPLIVLPVLVGS